MTEPFQTPSGYLAVRRYVPNRTALGQPMTAKADGFWVSVPFVSILKDGVDLKRNSQVTL